MRQDPEEAVLAHPALELLLLPPRQDLEAWRL